MRTIIIGIKDVLTTIRDFRSLAFLIIMPLSFVIVLGLAFGSQFNSERIKAFEIALVDNDNGEFAEMFKNQVFGNDELKEKIKYFVMSEESARSKVKGNDIPVAVIIPRDFSKNIKSNTNTEITVLKYKDDDLKGGFVEQLVKGFIEKVSLNRTAMTETVLNRNNLIYKDKTQKIAADINRDLSVGTEFKSSEESKKSVSASQYYSVAMLAMFLLFTAQIGTKSIIAEKDENTLARMFASGVSRISILAGKCIGVFFIAILQITIIILFTRFFMGVRWGGSITGLVLMGIFSAIAVSGISLLIAAVSKTAGTAQAISSIVMYSMSAIGGSFTPIYGYGSIMKVISNFTINKWILQGYLSLMNNNGIMDITLVLAIMLIIGISTLLLGSIRLKISNV